MNRILVDTNVVVACIEPGHVHHHVAVAAVRSLHSAGPALCIVPQVLYELWVVATRPTSQNGLGLSAAEADHELAGFGPPLFRLFRDERAIFDAWRELVRSLGVQGKEAHDARLVAAMQRHGITQLLTFNVADFRRYPGIHVLDPGSI